MPECVASFPLSELDDYLKSREEKAAAKRAGDQRQRQNLAAKRR